MNTHRIVHENIVYLPYNVDLSQSDYTRDMTILVSNEDFIFNPDIEPTYTKDELKSLNVCDLIIEPK